MRFIRSLPIFSGNVLNSIVPVSDKYCYAFLFWDVPKFYYFIKKPPPLPKLSCAKRSPTEHKEHIHKAQMFGNHFFRKTTTTYYIVTQNQCNYYYVQVVQSSFP